MFFFFEKSGFFGNLVYCLFLFFFKTAASFSMINSVRKDTKTNIPQYLCINKDQNATADKINQGYIYIYSSLDTLSLYWPVTIPNFKSRNRIRHTTADTINPGSSSRIIIYRLYKISIDTNKMAILG